VLSRELVEAPVLSRDGLAAEPVLSRVVLELALPVPSLIDPPVPEREEGDAEEGDPGDAEGRELVVPFERVPSARSFCSHAVTSATEATKPAIKAKAFLILLSFAWI